MSGNGAPFDAQTLTRQEEVGLVQRVFLTPDRAAPQVVLFSSVGHGNGSSRICARSGEILAAEGEGPVCVVDANLQSPSLHLHFGVGNEWGWAEALAHQGPIRDFARRSSQTGLWLLSSGSLRHGSAQRDRLRSRLADLRAEFQYVLIDASPANLHGDSIVLAPMTDGVVLVLEAHATRREIARTTKERLEAAGARFLGAVLNKRTFPVPDALYRWG